MKIKLLSFAVAILCTMVATAQQQVAAPKWAAKVQKAIFSLNTYDQKGELLHSGTAFYVGENGEAIADYMLFKDAYSAVAIDAKGNKSNVPLILGADETYSIVRFSVDTKKNAYLAIKKTQGTSHSINKGANIYALNFQASKVVTCPATIVEDTTSVKNKYGYYTLAADLGEKYVGCPLFDDNGELVGVVQQPFKGKGYAIDINFKQELEMKAIISSSASMALNEIHIRKGIPDTSEEALVYLYFKSRSASNEEYIDMLNQFIEKFPNNPEGYYRRITPNLDLHKFDAADADLNKFIELSTNKASAYSNAADAVYSKLVYQPTPAYDKWTYALAIEYIDRAIAVDNKLDYRIQKAKIYMANKDYKAALAIYDEINNGPERSSATYYAASLAHEQMNDSVSVQIALLDSAINLFGTPRPKEAANYVLYRAQLYEKAGEYRLAVIDYNDYCYLNNNKMSATFYYQRSGLEVKAKMYQQALDDINTAINMEPNEPLYVVEKSALLLRVNQIDECIEAARKCISMNSEMSDAYRILGYALIQKEDKENARLNLEKAVSLGYEAAQEIIDTYLK